MPKTVLSFIVLLAGLSMGCFPCSGFSRTPVEELLGQGLHQEEVERSYEDAIESYRAVLKAPDVTRAIAARALYRIGNCLIQLGRLDEARQTYEILLRDYPEQTPYSIQAGSYLASLDKENAETPRSSGIVIRKIVPSLEPSVLGSPSPDGRYFAYADSPTRNLIIQDLSTGAIERLTNTRNPMEGVMDLIRWSRDGKRILYFGIRTKDFSSGYRVIEIADRKIRPLQMENLGSSWDWGRDNESILKITSDDSGSLQLERFSIVDGLGTILSKFPSAELHPGSMKLSPDGKYIAFNCLTPGNNGGSDIYVWSLDHDRIVPAVVFESFDELVDWSPDGQFLLFFSDRNDTHSFWKVQIREGKPFGDAVLIKSDLDSVLPLGVTKTGALFYTLRRNKKDVYIQRLDPETGDMIGEPRPVSAFPFENKSSPIWSGNGKSLAYICGAAGSESVMPIERITGPALLCISSSEWGGNRKFNVGHIYRLFTWSPNGEEILVGVDGGVLRISAKDGRILKKYDSFAWNVLSDGRTALRIERDPETGVPSYIAHDLDTGAEWQIYKSDQPAAFTAVPSPDGKWMAATIKLIKKDSSDADQALIAVSRDTREVKHLLHRPQDNHVYMYGWSNDGKEIYYTALDEENSKLFRLWKVPLAGGKPVRLHFTIGGMSEIAFHPDGNLFAFMGMQDGSPELWEIENFLTSVPGETKSK